MAAVALFDLPSTAGGGTSLVAVTRPLTLGDDLVEPRGEVARLDENGWTPDDKRSTGRRVLLRSTI